MNKPSIVKFTAPPPLKNGDVEDAFAQIELLKKDLLYILGRLEKKINEIKN